MKYTATITHKHTTVYDKTFEIDAGSDAQAQKAFEEIAMEATNDDIQANWESEDSDWTWDVIDMHPAGNQPQESTL